ncbi:MAG: AAA family ATPase [Candidatus Omnitrophica bacterium]|nr:AAA family ATPase [Candidatus Omnitrophota bacterium]
MRKFIIWLKINWVKIALITLLVSIVISIGVYVSYIASSFNSLENFTKRQSAGMMAMTMPMFVFAQILVLPLSFGIMWYFYKGGGIGGIKKNKIAKDDFEVHWDDIIGMTEAKSDAKEVVNLLKDHALQKAVGGNIIKGALMIGPPGCGKTYLAKAMATECGLPMLTAAGSEFVAMFMGQGASRMKSLFKQARAEANIHGGCIIFIDEIDAFARQRAQASDGPGSAFSGGATTSYNATINQFLTEFDGLRKKENNIIILAATNVNEEELDEAIMRSGRFDRKIRVEKPNAESREEIFKYYLSKVSADPSLDIPHFADKTKWFSPSDINNVVKEAGVFAARNKHTQINADDMKSAVDRIMISIEKMGGDKILGDKVNVFWDDVIGMTDIKEEAWEIVKLLKDRNMAKAIGGKIVKGLVMFGPPGCGKTYLAKAIATESGFPFISVPGSEFVTMWMGEGAKKMKNVFAEARKMAKAEGGCIIFFDEIDSFARHRVQPSGLGGGISHNATINQFLTELDGLRKQENTIMVLGATNTREGDLDSAVTRAGRLERKLYVTLPTLDERKDLFDFYFSKVKIADDVTPDRWARIAVGVTPSDIDNIIREGGLLALRGNRDTINHKDLMDAYDRITIGAISREKYNKSSLLRTSYHETGHALMTYLVHPTNEVIKATIKPRKGALGYIWDRPIEELAVNSPNKEHWFSEIQVLLAGYVAEKISLGTTASGVGGGPGSDFHRATQIAHLMVWSLGMGSSGLIGDFSAVKGNQIAQKTLEILNADAQKILQDCLQNTTKILTEHRDILEYFSQELLEKGDLEYDDVQAIFNKFNLKAATKANNPSPLTDANPES